MPTKLSKPAARKLADKIRQGAGQIRDNLREMHDGEGWLALGHESWIECLEVEFGYSPSYASRQIKASEMVQRLLPIGNYANPPESHLRALAGLDEPQQEEALKNAIQTAEFRNQPLTAQIILDEVATWLPDPEIEESHQRHAEAGVGITEDPGERPVDAPTILDAEHEATGEEAPKQPPTAPDSIWGAIRRSVLDYVAEHGAAGIVLLEDLLEDAKEEIQ